MATPGLPLSMSQVWTEINLKTGTGNNLNNPLCIALRNQGNWPNPPSTALPISLSQLANKIAQVTFQATTTSDGNGVFSTIWQGAGRQFTASTVFSSISGASSSILTLANSAHVYTGALTVLVYTSNWSSLVLNRSYAYNGASGNNDTWWTSGVPLGLAGSTTYNFVIGH